MFVCPGAQHTARPAIHVPEGETESAERRMAGAASDVGEQTTAVVAVPQSADVQQGRQAGGGAAVPTGTCAQQGRHCCKYCSSRLDWKRFGN